MEISLIRDKHPGSATLLKRNQLVILTAYLRILLLLARSAQRAVNARHGRNGAGIGTPSEVCCLLAGGRAARATASPQTTCAAWRAGRGGRRRRRRPPARRRWPGATGRTNHMSFFLTVPAHFLSRVAGSAADDTHGSVRYHIARSAWIHIPYLSSCRIRMDPYHLAGSA
jgi:hypothetical protein